MVEWAKDDDPLGIAVGGRDDIPAHHLEVLINAASDHVRTKLIQANPNIASMVKSVVASATREVASIAHYEAANLAQAQAKIADLYRRGELDTGVLLDFASRREANETLIAMAMLCRIDASAAFRALGDSGIDTALLMAKVCDLSASAARTVLLALSKVPAVELDRAMLNYSRIKPETARHVLKLRTQPRARKSASVGSKPH